MREVNSRLGGELEIEVNPSIYLPLEQPIKFQIFGYQKILTGMRPAFNLRLHLSIIASQPNLNPTGIVHIKLFFKIKNKSSHRT